MSELTKKEMIKTIEKNIGKINDKSFTIYFYVFDTKGNPSGSLSYIYQTAYTLKELGYNEINEENAAEVLDKMAEIEARQV